MQKLVIRLIERMRKKNIERFVTNVTFVNKSNILLKVYPIPEFGKGKCSCGEGEIEFFTDDMVLCCSKCINRILGESLLKKKEALYYPSLEKSVRASVFEWSANNENWYRVRGSNVEGDSHQHISKEEIDKRFLAFMKIVLMGQPQRFDGTYNKEGKLLTVFF